MTENEFGLTVAQAAERQARRAMGYTRIANAALFFGITITYDADNDEWCIKRGGIITNGPSPLLDLIEFALPDI